jgi:hypothetical protein
VPRLIFGECVIAFDTELPILAFPYDAAPSALGLDPEPQPPPLLIPDAEGNMHQLRKGILVMRTDDGLVGRVRSVYGDGSAILAWGSRHEQASFGNLMFLTDSPPGEEKGAPLGERRNRFLKNLSVARSWVSGSDWCALDKLICFALDGWGKDNWFWQTLAESADDPRKVSFAPSPEFVDNNQRRRFCSIKKLLNLCNAKFEYCGFTDDEIRRISEAVGNHFPNDYDYSFTVVSGKSIVDAYTEGEYWGSCMQDRSYLTAFYAETPDKINLVKIMQGDKYVGRAMMWHTDQGKTVVDRVYPSDNGPHTGALHAWCIENGYDYKTRQACCDGHLASLSMDHTVTVKASTNGQYPYIDTFKYTNDDPEDSDTLTLGMDGGDYVFDQTGGGYQGDNSHCCNECGDRIDEDNCYSSDFGDTYCESCYCENYVHLNYQYGGRWVDETLHRDDACQCNVCEEYRADRHISTLDNGDYVCVICIEEGEASHCEGCGELFLSDELTVSSEDDGGDDCYRCADCHADHVKQRETDDVEEAEEEGAITEPVRENPAVLTATEYRLREGLGDRWRPNGRRCGCAACQNYYVAFGRGLVEHIESYDERSDRLESEQTFTAIDGRQLLCG